MPRFSYHPSKNCPICNERLWDDDPVSTVREAVYLNDHFHAVHPDFERWNKRLVRNYWITVPSLFTAPVVAVFLGAPTIILGPFIAGGFLWVVGTSIALERGKSRFRRQWNEEHGMASNPQ